MQKLSFLRAISMMWQGWDIIMLPRPKGEVEYVVIVAAGLDINAKISPAAKTFADRAKKLVKEGWAKTICVTGGNTPRFWGYPRLSQITEAQAVIDYLRELGYQGRLIVEDRSRITYENFSCLLEEIARIDKKKPPIKMIIINHPPHMGRTICVAQAQGIEVYPCPIKIPYTDEAIPAYMRKYSSYIQRQRIATIHHITMHLAHVALKKIGIHFSHPWM